MKKTVRQSNEIRQHSTGSSKSFVACILLAIIASTMALTLSGCEEELSDKSAKKAAVKYILSSGMEIAVTYDNSKELFRSDIWNGTMHYIAITDHKNQTNHDYLSTTGVWTSKTYSSSSGSSGDYTFKESDGTNVEKLADRKVAGKTCKSYKYTHKNGTVFITAVWNGIMMYQEDVITGSTMEATSVTLDFPASAFSQESIEVTWLK